MEFVKSRNHFGLGETKEIPCILGKGEPSTSTVGAVGSLYMDTDNGGMYKCVSAADGVYTWEPVVKDTGFNEDGEDGGYYIPNVTQPTSTTMVVEQTPSKADMPAVHPVTITLPVPDSSQNLNPIAKTEDMTQPVGVDENGQLYTAPGGGDNIIGGVATVNGILNPMSN